MNGLTKIAMLFDRVPPALFANLNAAARLLDVVAVEAMPESGKPDEGRATDLFRRVRLQHLNSATRPTRRGIPSLMNETLSAIRPDVVVLLGWSEVRDLSGLRWCVDNGVPAIVASDSNAYDFPRSRWKEEIKRQVVGLCSAAWAAGSRSSEYLAALGMPPERIVTGPVDTIDVEHFSAGAIRAREEAALTRARLDLPDEYFFASSRLAPEKNLFNLVEAYSLYRRRAGEGAWKLVIAGDGPLMSDIRQSISERALDEFVTLAGWVGFEELPSYYGLAGAFVHASTREPWGVVVNEAMAAELPVIVSRTCGCAPDLVREGVNGFTFDPHSPSELAELMVRVADGAGDREAMGRAGRKIIAGWTPVRYAESLKRVVDLALNQRGNRPSMLGRTILAGLEVGRRT